MRFYSIINFKQKWSPSYWVYEIASRIALSSVGGDILKKFEKVCSNSNIEIIKKTWWHFSLLNFASNYKLQDIQFQRKIIIHRVNKYDYQFWNGCFQGDALSRIIYEVRKGNFPCCIDDRFKIWDSFFENPINNQIEGTITEIKEEDVYPYFHPKYCPYNKISNAIGCKLFNDFVHLNNNSAVYIENEYQKIFEKSNNVLGVICRGTDYVNSKPKGHPIQPQMSEVVKKVKKYIRRYGYEYIYLATESEKIDKEMREYFPGIILVNDRKYYDSKMNKENLQWISEVHFERENDDYLRGLEYLSSLYILSGCKALVGGNCTGSRIAYFLNNKKYEHCYIFDKGVY